MKKNWKKIILNRCTGIFLSMAMVVSLVPTQAFANDIMDAETVEEETSDSEEVATENEEEGTADTNTSSEEMVLENVQEESGGVETSETFETEEYIYTVDEENNATITKYRLDEKVVVIPKEIDGHKVTAIGEEAFRKKTELETITIPDTVKEIGDKAFYYCNILEKVYLPSGLEKLGIEAFGHTAITDIVIPKTLIECEMEIYSKDGPFSNCSELKTVIFENGIKKVPSYVMSGASIEKAFIPDTVTTIGYCSFRDCVNLKDIDLPKGLVELDGEAFAGTSITSIFIPKSLSICWGMSDGKCGPFFDCSDLKTVQFEEGVTTIVRGLFDGCNGLENVDIPDTVTVIEKGAFSACSKLKYIDIPDKITVITENSFARCTSLTSVDIPDGVTIIEALAFSECTNLISLKIPDSVVEIGGYAFYQCEKLTDVKLPSKLKELGGGSFSKTSITEITIPSSVVYNSSPYSSKTSPFWECSELKKVTFEEGITEIPSYILKDTLIEKVDIPDSVVEIGDYAFWNCTSLVDVELSEGLEKLGCLAFGNTGISSITIPKSFKDPSWWMKGHSPFEGCLQLKMVVFEEGLTKIPYGMFIDCGSIESVMIPNTVTEIGRSAFADCTNLKEIVIPSSVEHIDMCAFYGCSSLTNVSMNEGIRTIGLCAFSHCTSLKKIELPNSVEYLEDYAFEHCYALEEVSMNCKITTIASYLFSYDNALHSIILPYHIKEIQTCAFAYCDDLTDIYMNRNVEKIADDAFSYPDKTTIYGIFGTYPETFAKEKGYKFVGQDIKVEKISLNATDKLIFVGEELQLGLVVEPSNFTELVKWNSSDTDVIVVDQNGLVKAVGVGTATIEVKVGELTANCNITVLQPIIGITLNKSNIKVSKGRSYQLVATVNPSNAANKELKWISSNEEVAVVDATGKVTTKKAGTATITCSAMDGSGVSATCQVTVTDPVKVTRIILNKTNAYLSVNEVLTLTKKVYPSNATNKNVSFSSSNIKVATVDSNGKVTAKSAGTATITCTARDGSGVKATCKVTVYSNTEAFVARIYTKALGRDPEPAGLKYWTNEINTKKRTPVNVAESFFFAPEFTNKNLSDTEYVKVLYRTFMGREYDQGGLNYWLGRLAKGESRKSVMKAFASCPEFQKIVKSFGL